MNAPGHLTSASVSDEDSKVVDLLANLSSSIMRRIHTESIESQICLHCTLKSVLATMIFTGLDSGVIEDEETKQLLSDVLETVEDVRRLGQASNAATRH